MEDHWTPDCAPGPDCILLQDGSGPEPEPGSCPHTWCLMRDATRRRYHGTGDIDQHKMRTNFKARCLTLYIQINISRSIWFTFTEFNITVLWCYLQHTRSNITSPVKATDGWHWTVSSVKDSAPSSSESIDCNNWIPVLTSLFECARSMAGIGKEIQSYEQLFLSGLT